MCISVAPPAKAKSQQVGDPTTPASTQPQAYGDVNDPNSPAYADLYNSLPASTRAYAYAPGSVGAQNAANTTATQAAHPGQYADFSPMPAATTPNPVGTASPSAGNPNPLGAPPVNVAGTPNPLGTQPTGTPPPAATTPPPATVPNPLGAPVTPAPTTTTDTGLPPNPLATGVTTPVPKAGAVSTPGALFQGGGGYRVSNEYSPNAPADVVTNALMRRRSY